MSDFRIALSKNSVPPDEVARRLARVYSYILSLPDQPDEEINPVESASQEANELAKDEQEAINRIEFNKKT